MADQAEATEQAARSPLDQAAADGSITQARTRAVDPVPIVPDAGTSSVAGSGAGSATLEPVLETNEPDMGVKTSVNPEAPIVDGLGDGAVHDGTAVAPVAGARRRLSPRPVPVSRRRTAPATTDEERTPAEEMDDVGTQDDKAAATKTARPKTAAEIVAEQRAREKAAAEGPAAASSEDAAAGTPAAATDAAQDAGAPQADKPATGASGPATGASGPATAASGPATGAVGKPAAKPSGASGNKPPVSKSGSAGSGKGKQALTSVGSGVRKLRNLIASLIWLIAVLAAAVLALGALFTALDQTNQSNEIVRWILERGHDLVGPFKDLFRLQTAKNTLLVNWGIAALVYLIAGKIVEKLIRP
ncbi:hypothetical protein JOF29_002184 [Kribbella aluminosa]|uniref:Uncharacterized protein n=1 Tax=Kribbella aluminosa TaxID=416017 RepID=A0ABS4UHQ6_9ACTN|nr:hypothetical protein [Kribbella aluminosa]MBP2351101.1 hypothetical protein [Kribbella aluminosa]